MRATRTKSKHLIAKPKTLKRKSQESVVSTKELPINQPGPRPGPPVQAINAIIVSLRARPIQAAHLCFPVNGVIDQVTVRIGDATDQFDTQSLIASMLQFPTGADPSLLSWDADAIANWAGQYNEGNGALMTLRDNGAYAALDQAINARSNAYFAKYANPAAVVQALQNTYLAPNNFSSPPVQSKSQHLANLMNCSQQQWTGLSNQYGQINFTTLNGVTTPLSNPAVVDHTESDIATNQPEVDSQTTGSGGENVFEQSQTYAYKVQQTITNKDFVFRIPFLEAQAQYERAQLSLADELFAETTRQQTVQNYQQVLTNELNAINLGVYRLQIAYLNTLLTAPFSGTVTGVYKQPGEAVRAGETVVRVEDNSEVYLLGTVVCPNLIQGRQPPDTRGMTATINTSLYDAGGNPSTLTAEVLTARGRGADDTWELVLWYVNDGNSGPILPLDYCFDFDDTTISFA
jgi:biotin carboxyl carrier protein